MNIIKTKTNRKFHQHLMRERALFSKDCSPLSFDGVFYFISRGIRYEITKENFAPGTIY